LLHSGGTRVPRRSERIEDAVGREREPLIARAEERAAGADGQRERNLPPGLPSVERGGRDDVLERPLDPRGDDVVRTDWVHRDGRLLGFVSGPSPEGIESGVARPDGIGSRQLNKRAGVLGCHSSVGAGHARPVGVLRSAQPPPSAAERTTLSIVRIVSIVPPC